MKLIAAVDSKWGIGKNGALLTSIPEDMRFFKETTKNKVLIMGYKTLLSLPNSKPLKRRLNIILSKSAETNVDGSIVCSNIEQLLFLLKAFNTDDIIVIGGGVIFHQLLPYCKTAYITKMRFDGDADAFMPNLDEIDSWEVVNESDCKDYKGLKYSFIEYINNNVQSSEFAAVNSNMSSYFKNEESIYLDFINFGDNGINDLEESYNDLEESYLVELRDLLHAYFRPIEYGFNTIDILHYIEECTYKYCCLEEYLRYKRYIASKEDIIRLFDKYNPKNELKFTTIQIKKEELDLFESCIDSFSSFEQIVEKFKNS